VRKREHEQGRHHEPRHGDEHTAVEAEAERDHEEGRDQGPEREADVAAD
jgi:hypothetical protein